MTSLGAVTYIKSNLFRDRANYKQYVTLFDVLLFLLMSKRYRRHLDYGRHLGNHLVHRRHLDEEAEL
jgi:hypothetical protein